MSDPLTYANSDEYVLVNPNDPKVGHLIYDAPMVDADTKQFIRDPETGKIKVYRMVIWGTKGLTQAQVESLITVKNATMVTRVTNIENRLNTVLDSDDTDLDQLSELVTEIKANRSNIALLVSNKATKEELHSAVNTLATNVYTKSETYNKTETNDLVAPKADNDSVVHLADAETITGNKTFTGEVNVPTVAPNDNSTKVASTAFVKDAVETLTGVNIKNIVDKFYPVGSIYISVNSTNPGALFGGTWEQIQEKFLLSAGNTHKAGTTGGEFTHTLTTAEMPVHNHTASSNSTGAHTHTRGTMEIEGAFSSMDAFGREPSTGAFTDSVLGAVGVGGSGSTDLRVTFTASHNWSGATSKNGDHSHTITVNNNGSGNAHNNTPPYLAVYMWKRVA